MYDIHAHVLYETDDGARSREESLEMCRVAARSGTKVMLATPHRKDVTENLSVSHIVQQTAELNAQISEIGLSLTLALGMENHLDETLPDEIAAGRALTIDSGPYILIEMPFFGRPDWIEDTLYRVQRRGLIPILAHPERIEAFQRDPDMLAGFIERGMLSQITVGSIVGTWGEEVMRFTHLLLRRRMAHVMASDTHSPTGLRNPDLRPGVGAAAYIVGASRAVAMAVHIPKAILNGEPIEVESPIRRSDPISE